MKKGLLSILASALLVVGCQNYDDQFSALETQINALASTVAGLSQVQSDLCTRNYSNKFSFSKTNSSNRLCFGTVYNRTTAISKNKTSSRSTFVLVICISSVVKKLLTVID